MPVVQISWQKLLNTRCTSNIHILIYKKTFLVVYFITTFGGGELRVGSFSTNQFSCKLNICMSLQKSRKFSVNMWIIYWAKISNIYLIEIFVTNLLKLFHNFWRKVVHFYLYRYHWERLNSGYQGLTSDLLMYHLCQGQLQPAHTEGRLTSHRKTIIFIFLSIWLCDAVYLKF